MSYLDMPQVGGQRQHCLIDIDAQLMPAHQRANGKGVAQIMNANSDMCATICPAQFGDQLDEHAMNLAISQRLAQQLSTRANEEGGVHCGADLLAAKLPVVRQGLDRTGMQRYP